MIAPSPELHTLFEQHYIATRLSAFIAGGGLVRFLVYVSAQMPPLPTNSGWWAQWFYKILKGTSGLDPQATIVPPKAPEPAK